MLGRYTVILPDHIDPLRWYFITYLSSSLRPNIFVS
jgi:hypothetical protein